MVVHTKPNYFDDGCAAGFREGHETPITCLNCNQPYHFVSAFDRDAPYDLADCFCGIYDVNPIPDEPDTYYLVPVPWPDTLGEELEKDTGVRD